MKFGFVAISISFALLLTPLTGQAFKVSTHLITADEVIDSIEQGDHGFFVVIDGKSYRIDSRVGEAILNYPDLYRGGTVGPDGFPDLITGQSMIHPNSRCEEPTANPFDCDRESGVTSFTYDWLQYVYDRGWQAYMELCDPDGDGSPTIRQTCNDEAVPAQDRAEAQKILAFTYGYMMHAAGDVWAHTFVNFFSRGVFPDLLTASPSICSGSTTLERLGCLSEEKKIAIRHIVVEGYIEKHDPPGFTMSLNAPTEHLTRTFVRTSNTTLPTRLATDALYANFIDLWHNLDDKLDNNFCDPGDFLGSLGFLDELLTLGASQGYEELCKDYLQSWKNQIRYGLDDWTNMSLAFAKAMFENGNTDAAFEVISEWSDEHLVYMLGKPKINYPSSLEKAGETIEAITAFVMDPFNLLGALKDYYMSRLQNYLAEQIFGVSLDDLKEMYTHPESYIDAEELDLQGTSTELLSLMHPTNPTPPVFDINYFAPVVNTIALGRLSLLTPEAFDELLFERHVGVLYTGGWLAAFEESGHRAGPAAGEWVSDRNKQTNAILGFIMDIDGSHQWRLRTPSDIFPEYGRFSELMPIWEDCLARKRFFGKYFKDWDHYEVTSFLSETCSALGELPPVSHQLFVNGKEVEGNSSGASTTISGCGAHAAVRLINHQDTAQNYGIYLQLHKIDATAAGGDQLIWHDFQHGMLQRQPDSEIEKEFEIPCADGGYRVDSFLYKRLRSFDISKNVTIPARPQLYREEVWSHRYSTLFLDVPDDGCPVPGTLMCPDGTVDSPVVDGGVTVPCMEPLIPVRCNQNLPPIADIDLDDDSIINREDNCPFHANANQSDANGNDLGDACDTVTALAEWFDDLFNMRDRVRADAVAAKIDDYLGNSVPFDGDRPGGNPCSCNGLCLSCPETQAALKGAINDKLRALDRNQLREDEVYSMLTRLSGIIEVEQTNLPIRSFKVEQKGLFRRTVEAVITVDPVYEGYVVIRLDKSRFQPMSRRGYLVTVAGKATAIQTRITETDTRIIVPIMEGQSEIRVRGSQIVLN